MVGSRRFHGNAEYLLDWDAVAAIGSLLAVIAAVVTVVYSVKLVHKQLAYQEAASRADAEAIRVGELKRFEQDYLRRIFDVADRTYDAIQDLVLRLQADSAGRRAGLTVETINAPLQAAREYAATTAAILNVLKASRTYRFPPDTIDAVFVRYEKVVNTVVKHNSDLVKAVVNNPPMAEAILRSEMGQNVFYLNQLVKSCTGKLIALMFGRANEWDAPNFITFIDDLIVKPTNAAVPPTE